MATHANLTLSSGITISTPTGILINNEWSASSDGAKFLIHNPATGEELLEISHATPADVDRAVAAARLAFNTTWGRNSVPSERAKLINKLADLIERDADRLRLANEFNRLTCTVACSHREIPFQGELESLNSGKGVRMAKDFDLGDTVACLRYNAGWADKITGETLDLGSKSKMAFTLAEPAGVCGQIIPWNYPMLMWAWKVAPALAAGCCLVMKPSELTPLTALALADLIIEAGFPPGVVNTLPGFGRTTGAAISSHMDIDQIAFTGSVITGRTIMCAAAMSNLKKCTLELGGKSPSIIFPSADLEQAAIWSAMGVFYNSGQDCCAATRLYVHESIYDEFMPLLIAKAKACAIGDPLDQKTSFGPLISAVQRDKVLSYIQSGIDQGATIATGGKRWGDKGFFIEPTIITDTKDDMKCFKEEIFGPVLVVAKFKTEDEVIKRANDSIYGLGAGVFSNDAKQVMRVAGELLAGSVWVNQYNIVTADTPFGGYKQSGIGRELGAHGIQEYTTTKTVHYNISQEITWPL